MAISNRYSSVARPDLIIIEYQFHIHSMPKAIRKRQLKFDRDTTVGSKVMAISNLYSSLARSDLIITEYRFVIHSMQKGMRKLQLKFDRDPTVESKFWLFRTVTQAWRDQTSSSPSIDSSSTPCKRASGNSSKSLTAIQRSDQKLWPF